MLKLFLLPDQEDEKANTAAIERIVHIAQPLSLVVVVALRLVAEDDHHRPTGARGGLSHLRHQTHARGRVQPSSKIRVIYGFRQVGQEWSFGMVRLMFTNRLIAGVMRILVREQRAHLIDGLRLAQAWCAVNYGALNAVAQAARHQPVQGLNGRRGEAIMADGERMQLLVDRPRL